MCVWIRLMVHSASVCPVCSARACPFHPLLMFICAYLSCSSALQWVTWLPCTLPHSRFYTLPWLSLLTHPAVTLSPPPSSTLISSLVPLLCIPSPPFTALICWYLRALICSLNGPAEPEWISCSVWPWRMQAKVSRKRKLRFDKVWNRKLRWCRRVSLGKIGDKIHIDLPAQRINSSSRTFVVGADQLYQRDYANLSHTFICSSNMSALVNVAL